MRRERSLCEVREFCAGTSPSEAESYTELRRARLAVATAQCGEDQEIRQPLVGRWVAEVCRVEDVEQLEVRVDGRLPMRTEPVCELHVGLTEGRPFRAVATSLRFGA